MPSPYQLGAKNAIVAFEDLLDSQVAIGLVASATGDATVTTLGFNPDWVIATVNVEGDLVNVGWSATANTLTFVKSATTAASISYIAGNLS